MINMMTDLLQYLPYVIVIGAVFLLVFAGIVYTISHFRKAEKRRAGR